MLSLGHHARERMSLRRVSEKEIVSAVEEYDDVVEANGDTQFIKFIRRFDGMDRPLHVIAKPLETQSRTRNHHDKERTPSDASGIWGAATLIVIIIVVLVLTYVYYTTPY